MKKSKFSDAEILAALMSVEAGLLAQVLCWELGITAETFRAWQCSHRKAMTQALAKRETDLLLTRLRKWHVWGSDVLMEETLRAANLQAVFDCQTVLRKP